MSDDPMAVPAEMPAPEAVEPAPVAEAPMDEAPAEEAAPEEAGEAEPEAEPPSPAVSQTVLDHVSHALDHMMHPGEAYQLTLHGEPAPLTGVLLGSNDLGAVFQAHGTRGAAFHPWAAIRGLLHLG